MSFWFVNPLDPNPTKWSNTNTLKNFLSVFDHFVLYQFYRFDFFPGKLSALDRFEGIIYCNNITKVVTFSRLFFA